MMLFIGWGLIILAAIGAIGGLFDAAKRADTLKGAAALIIIGGALVFFGSGGENAKVSAAEPHPSKDADKSVEHAYILCQLFDTSRALSNKCAISGWNGSVDISADMSSSEAREMCATIPGLVQKAGLDFAPRWTVRVYSPYSGDNTIAVCNLS